MLSLSQFITKVLAVKPASVAVKPASEHVTSLSDKLAWKPATWAVFLARLIWNVDHGETARSHMMWPLCRANEKQFLAHSQSFSSGLASKMHQVTLRLHGHVWLTFMARASCNWKSLLNVLQQRRMWQSSISWWTADDFKSSGTCCPCSNTCVKSSRQWSFIDSWYSQCNASCFSDAMDLILVSNSCFACCAGGSSAFAGWAAGAVASSFGAAGPS